MASRRGRSHAHTGAFRDDVYFALHVTGPEGLERLGRRRRGRRRKRSRIGSRVAAHTAVAVAAEKLQTQPYVWPVAANEANATDLTAMHKAAYNALGAAPSRHSGKSEQKQATREWNHGTMRRRCSWLHTGRSRVESWS